MSLLTGFLIPLGLSAAKGIRKFVGVIQNRRQLHELSHWDRHALKDIGLTPSDLVGAFSLPIHQDPSEHLAQMSGRSPRKSSEEDLRVSQPTATSQGTNRPAPLPSNRPALSA
ncbi:MAG: hypothetical protein CTY25_03025 [Methylobacterium sp.]|nr:MAG: hypothetical protein CTY25_03025 [Methylobacterium sp.]